MRQISVQDFNAMLDDNEIGDHGVMELYERIAGQEIRVSFNDQESLVEMVRLMQTEYDFDMEKTFVIADYSPHFWTNLIDGLLVIKFATPEALAKALNRAMKLTAFA